MYQRGSLRHALEGDECAHGRYGGLRVFTPLLAVLTVVLIVVAFMVFTSKEESLREAQVAESTAHYLQQRIRIKLLDQQNQLSQLAHISLKDGRFDAAYFQKNASLLIHDNSDLLDVFWLNKDGRLISRALSWHSMGDDIDIPSNDESEPINFQDGVRLASSAHQTVFIQTRSISKRKIEPLRLFVPIFYQEKLLGVMAANLSLPILYSNAFIRDLKPEVEVAFLDADGNVLVGNTSAAITSSFFSEWFPWSKRTQEFTTPISPVGIGLLLRTTVRSNQARGLFRDLLWFVFALGVITVWMLLANWRYTTLQLRMRRKLQNEMNFRRAMEKSMLTGLRVIDQQGKITYVNAAFSHITGWRAEEVVGQNPPYSFWPADEIQVQQGLLEMELSGSDSAKSIETRIQHRDGRLIDIQRFISPLIDDLGVKTGWIVSIIDITESKRVGLLLSESYRRFTTVLEALNAAIIVTPIESGDILFTNRVYKAWFGSDEKMHPQLAETVGLNRAGDAKSGVTNHMVNIAQINPLESESSNFEVYISEQGRWLDVRANYLYWTDGRLAYMLVATDISERKKAEDQSKQQAAHAQNVGRLVTMGEMASSVAHELNQPLAAISNYCSGMITRIKNQQIQTDDLIKALEKTSSQAIRAGQVIQRIRNFVRRSEPKRVESTVKQIVEDAIDLASLDYKRYSVKLLYLPKNNLPNVYVDPILIEQVLINLLRNAAESIDQAKRISSDRIVKLEVSEKNCNEKEGIEFVIEDHGTGLLPEIADHLFEAFRTTKPDGLGVGLNICRSIIESHKGRMFAENIYNETQVAGCRFSFWIPIDGN